ncbi:MAG: hypothetical protein IKI01_08985 [Lachnospiraceae bacterium]|nr:hypothetical protein [Lachnospiraceae bacterium]
MKAFRRVVLLTAVLCLYGLFSCLKASFAGDSKDSEKKEWMHTITITDGHVEDGNGRTVTEAKVGDYLYIIPDLQSGSYVKEWLMNGESVWYSSFTMPDCDITIEAVRDKQTPLVLDLSAGAKVNYPDYNIIYDIVQYIGDYLGIEIWDATISDDTPDYGVDVDRDGTKDLFISSIAYREGLDFYLFRKEGGSVRGDVVLSELSNLPYWPITLRFGDDTPAAAYSLNVIDGYATKRWKPDDIITSVRPGEQVEVVYPWNKDYALIHWESDDIPDIMSYCFAYRDRDHSNYSFPMPSSNLTVRPVTEKKKPYVITFSNGVADTPYDVAVCAAESTGYIYDIDMYSSAKLDLDGNGTEDVMFFGGKFYVLSSTCSVKGEITLEGLNGGLYWPTTLQVGDYQNEYSISVAGGHAEDQNGNVITKSASGEKIKLVRDKEEETFFESWSSNCGVTSDYMNFDCIMPAQNVTFTAETTTSQKEYTVDLTVPEIRPKNEEEVLLKNALWAFMNEHGMKDSGYWKYLDLDFDGQDDVFWGNALGGDDSIEMFLSRNSLYKYSLGTSFTLHLNDGQIGTLNIVVDNEKTSDPVRDTSTETTPTPTPRPTATPTVRPTATPTLTPTATPVPSLTITPEEDNTKPQPTSSQMASEPGEDSVHPFTLLIAGLVLCMVGVGFYAVLYLRRMKDKSDMPE